MATEWLRSQVINGPQTTIHELNQTSPLVGRAFAWAGCLRANQRPHTGFRNGAGSPSSKEKVIAVTLRSLKGELTFYALNLSDQAVPAEVHFTGLEKPVTLRRYQVTEATVSQPGFKVDALETNSLSAGSSTLQLQLPARSITPGTTYFFAPDRDGAIRE